MPGKYALRYIDPVKEFGGLLLNTEKPGRYIGGEAGILSKKDDTAFHTLIAFPDLYEIGMVNQALRIIYNRLNKMEGISCDRAFAPAPDFEKLLREKNIPLYGLDTGISLSCLDMLMFTISYELGLNGILLMLNVSGIPLRCTERNEENPVVIAGGPVVSNPLPFSPFIDAFWIGEAEAGFFDLVNDIALLKSRGQSRAGLLEKLSSHPNVWVKGKKKILRAVFSGFSFDETEAAVFPIPSMKIIQHHGAVEIMRGCPNGCRFCFAGFWYRPMRQKSREHIIAQVNEMVTKGGWQEISLSSLSSGDYCGIEELVDELNGKFSSMHVSFQMPSLKVSGFSLGLLEKISVTRKSGLTFAVETPCDMWQAAINKEVTRDSIVSILEEAKKRGWKSAKFYFMIGLPLPDIEKSEHLCEEEIVDFILDIARKSKMRFSINVGIFIPKPHTPYQWVSQLNSEEALEKMEYIRLKLKPMGHKVSIADTLISKIEGVLSRGDERAGLLCEQAFLGGSRLEAWTEYINREVWQNLFEINHELIDEIMSGRENLSWDVIDSCVKNEYFMNELKKSNECKYTESCAIKCGKCGICNRDIKMAKNKPILVNRENKMVNVMPSVGKRSDPSIYRVLFNFSKKDSSVFHGHLSLIEIFSLSLRRACIPAIYTKGFNPLVKLEFPSPLSTGITADCEFASIDFFNNLQVDNFVSDLNKCLPQGIYIVNAEVFFIKSGMKKHSLSSLLWGFAYYGMEEKIDYVEAKKEKIYRQERLSKDCETIFTLRRKEVLARNIMGGSNEWASYFDVYRFLYP
ncbi:MAG: TIGR03936 family radical SAM-associated protein [Treponema sp.]|jgi:radical SAM-linked protein|nr:TIGR03936 family radical SAM-associated protein [Treponema sp.]